MQPLEFRFAFHAQDFDRSLTFYEGSLGFTRVGGWDRPDGKGALFSAGGSAVVEIYGAAQGTTYTGPSPQAINLAVRLEDRSQVDALFAALNSQEANLDGEPVDRIWGHRSFVIYDPDGIPIHIYCEL